MDEQVGAAAVLQAASSHLSDIERLYMAHGEDCVRNPVQHVRSWVGRQEGSVDVFWTTAVLHYSCCTRRACSAPEDILLPCPRESSSSAVFEVHRYRVRSTHRKIRLNAFASSSLAGAVRMLQDEGGCP